MRKSFLLFFFDDIKREVSKRKKEEQKFRQQTYVKTCVYARFFFLVWTFIVTIAIRPFTFT
jgi:hypothetical protein